MLAPRFKIDDHVLVIMDPSDKKRNYTIMKYILMYTGPINNALYCGWLSPEHRNMKVIKFKADCVVFAMIRDTIELLYPGLCMFNPPMYV